MARVSSTRVRSRFGFASSALAALLLSNVARAQTDAEVAARRQLIDDARSASASGDHARAVDLATRASRLRMTPSLRAFLAAELLAAGQVVRAISNAEQCTSELRRDATVNDRDRLIQDCQRIAQEGSARVGRVSIEGVSDSLPGLVVRVQGEALNAALIGVATVVDPGTVFLEVSATGYRPQRQEARVESRQTVVVRFSLEREQPAAANSASAASAANTTGAAAANTAAERGADTRASTVVVRSDPPPPSAQPRPSPSLAGPIAVTTAGGVVLATGALFFGLQALTFGDCRVEQNENVCDGRTTVEQATPSVTYNRLAIASSIVGGAALISGVTWLAIAARAGREAPSTVVAPMADASSVGIIVRGAL